jgi:uncharacterized protein YaiE (UPF0345 family)
MKVASKFLVAVGVAAAVGSAFAAGPGWHGGAGPAAGAGPGFENCAMTGGPGAGAGYGPMMGGMGGGGRMGGGGMMNPAAAESRLDGVKGALKITAEQESAWNAYAGVVKAQAETRAKFREQMASSDPTARTELQSKHFAANAEAAKQIGAARDGLYAVLTPEQKATADRLIGFSGFARRGHAAPGS